MADHAPMDEFEWEEFMKRSDEMADRFSELLEKYWDLPDRDERIAKEMGWTVVKSDEFPEIIEPTDEEYAEDMQELLGIPYEETMRMLKGDPLEKSSFAFAVDFMHWVDHAPEPLRSDKDLLAAAQFATVPGAKIASAVGFGEEGKMELGFRIALYKRAIAATNAVIDAFAMMREKGTFVEAEMAVFAQRISQLRIDIAERIIETREKFNAGP